MLDEKEIISLVKKRLDEDSCEIYDRVFSSVAQELRAREQGLAKGIVNTQEVPHPPIEKLVLRDTDALKPPPKKKAWWKIRKN